MTSPAGDNETLARRHRSVDSIEYCAWLVSLIGIAVVVAAVGLGIYLGVQTGYVHQYYRSSARSVGHPYLGTAVAVGVAGLLIGGGFFAVGLALREYVRIERGRLGPDPAKALADPINDEGW